MRSGWSACAASATAIRSRTRRPGILAAPGSVSERPKEHASKACVGESPPWVQIPPLPHWGLDETQAPRVTKPLLRGPVRPCWRGLSPLVVSRGGYRRWSGARGVAPCWPALCAGTGWGLRARGLPQPRSAHARPVRTRDVRIAPASKVAGQRHRSVNGIIELHRRIARGYRNPDNYRLL